MRVTCKIKSTENLISSLLFSSPVNVACPICNCLFISPASSDGCLLLKRIGPGSGNNRELPGRGGLLSVKMSPVFSSLVFVKRLGRKDQG